MCGVMTSTVLLVGLMGAWVYTLLQPASETPCNVLGPRPMTDAEFLDRVAKLLEESRAQDVTTPYVWAYRTSKLVMALVAERDTRRVRLVRTTETP